MGFKVTRDFIKEKDEKGAVGIESATPNHIFQMLSDVPEGCTWDYNGGKIKVRLKDCDGNIYYHGLVDDDDFSCELFLTWGGSYAGTTDLDMHMDNYLQLNEKVDYASLVSKDGKWFHYMG